MAQQRKNNNNNNKVNMPRPSYMLYGLAALFIIGWAIIGGGSEAPQPSDWSSVARMVEQGDVARIQVVNRDQAQVFLTEEAIEKYRKDTSDKQFGRIPENGAQFFFTIGSVDSFREDLKAAEELSGHEVPVIYKNEKSDWTSLLINLLPWVVLIGAWFFIMRSNTARASAAKKSRPPRPKMYSCTGTRSSRS